MAFVRTSHRALVRAFFFGLIFFLPAALPPLFAQTASVTNNGNIPVHVQFKTADLEYQDMELQPGQSQELPGGVEKVKVVRNPGEWASPAKPGETIEVTVKEGDRVVGTAGWYGAKVFFSSPTAAPTTQLQLQSEPPPESGPAPGAPQTPVPVVKETAGSQAPAAGSGKGETTTSAAPEPGSITNNGYLPMNITFQGANGETQTVFLKMNEKMEIPAGTTGMTLRQPMVYSGITFGKKAVDVVIIKPSGETTQLSETPFEGAEINLRGSASPYEFKYDWKLDLKSGFRLDAGFGDETGKWKKDNEKDSEARDIQYDDTHWDRGIKYDY